MDNKLRHSEASDPRSPDTPTETPTLSAAQQTIVDLGTLSRRSGAGKHTEDLRDK